MNELPTTLCLAPMAEISTPALRRAVKEFCPAVTVFSEMLWAGAVACRGRFNAPLLQKTPLDDPLIYQIAGCRPDVMAEACSVLEEQEGAGININMGCAAPAIIKKRAGASLLREPALAREIVRQCRRRVRGSLSVKLRSGFDRHDPGGLVETARMLEGEGADFIILHPRYARLYYLRSADWSLVGLLKRSVSIPVIGNGDIRTPEEARARMEASGCDGIMLGRRAVQQPWIFALIEKQLRGESAALEVDLERVFLQVLGDIALLLPENLHKSRGLRFCFYFTKNLRFGHELFTAIRKSNSLEETAGLVRAYFERQPGERLVEYP